MLCCVISEESNVVKIVNVGKCDVAEWKAAKKRKSPNKSPLVGRWSRREHRLFVEGMDCRKGS